MILIKSKCLAIIYMVAWNSQNSNREVS